MTRMFLAVIFLAALCGSARAADGDVEAGRALVYTCAGCHGVPGYENAYPNYRVPRIAGQYEQYIVSALTAYQSGEREHPTMGAQADGLSTQDIQNVAAYLSSLKLETPVSYSASVEAPKAVATCVACHGTDGNSIDPQYPRLAGQYASYIAQTLTEYRTGERSNPIMKGFASTLSKQDIEAVANYFAGLPSILDDLHGHVQGAD